MGSEPGALILNKNHYFDGHLLSNLDFAVVLYIFIASNTIDGYIIRENTFYP